MNFRNNKSSNRPGTLTVKGVPYSLVRSEIFYYLKVIDYNKDLFKTASNLTSKPSVVFYTENSENKVIFDYSSANQTDKEYLLAFFANMNQLDTLTITGADYLDKAELQANLGCTLTFSSYKDNKLFATVNSVKNQNQALDVYDPNYFISSPQLVKTEDLGNLPVTKETALVSVNTATNAILKNLGLIEGDIIELINENSLNDKIKLQVTKISNINEKEVVKIAPVFPGQVVNIESLVGSATLLNVYIKGTTDKFIDLNGTLGCCRDLNGNTNISNQTKSQCEVRSSSYAFTEGACPETTGIVAATELTSPFTSDETTEYIKIYLRIQYTESPSFVVNSGIAIQNNTARSFSRFNIGNTIPQAAITATRPIGSIVSVSENGIINNTNAIQLKKGKSYMFIQEDLSNAGVTLRITSTNYQDLDALYYNTQTSVGNVTKFNVPFNIENRTVYLAPIAVGLGTNISELALEITD